MKTPVDVVKGRITNIDQYGTVTIVAHYDDWNTLLKRNYQECEVQMIDSRPLSDKQRRACYALLKVIAEYTGIGTDRAKEYMKIKFLTEDVQQTADKIFSLSSAPMSLVCAFQRFLVRFIIDWEIPCDFPLMKYVDDVGDYIYACLESKRCCICGKPSDLHHVDRVGMGNDRDEIIHEGMRVLPLCREHHNEAHSMPMDDFAYRYHIDDGIVLDKHLCKIYGLKTRKGKSNEQDNSDGKADQRPGSEVCAD